jgi:hypothetical protein
MAPRGRLILGLNPENPNSIFERFRLSVANLN